MGVSEAKRPTPSSTIIGSGGGFVGIGVLVGAGDKAVGAGTNAANSVNGLPSAVMNGASCGF